MHATALLALAIALMFFSCGNAGGDKKSNTMKDTTKIHEDAAVYTCPMHPEITGKKGDKCSKCGMDLEPQKQTNSTGHFEMQLQNRDEKFRAGIPSRLSFTGATAGLEETHEKMFHLIIVSDDLAWFHHIHPERNEADNSYAVTETFPAGGRYLLFADYKPKGGQARVDRFSVNVEGTPRPATVWKAPKLISNTGEYEVHLINGGDISPGAASRLQIAIRENGKELKSDDLQKYLGAVAHLIMIGRNEHNFIHVHPGSSPIHTIEGEVTVDAPGIYRLWVQFQVDGKVHTADFAVDVKKGGSVQTVHTGGHSHHHWL